MTQQSFVLSLMIDTGGTRLAYITDVHVHYEFVAVLVAHGLDLRALDWKLAGDCVPLLRACRDNFVRSRETIVAERPVHWFEAYKNAINELLGKFAEHPKTTVRIEAAL